MDTGKTRQTKTPNENVLPIQTSDKTGIFVPKRIAGRYEFVLVMDVIDGNPNGDPDHGGIPRTDPNTEQGEMTPMSIKRKVRDYITLKMAGQAGFDIFVKNRAVLNHLIAEAVNSKEVASLKEKDAKEMAAISYLCRYYFDIRAFGGVLSTGDDDMRKKVTVPNVTGTVQIMTARSVDKVDIQRNSITRVAVTSEKESDEQKGLNQTCGVNYTIPYGLYVAKGFISAFQAERTGFSENDLALLWDALLNMLEHDRSTSRGFMSTRKLIVFKHDSMLGNCAAFDLFERVKIEKKVAIPMSFSDYDITVNTENMPEGVSVSVLR